MPTLAAGMFSKGCGAAKEIVKNDLQRRFAKPELRNLRQIAIDEISIGKRLEEAFV